jgi:hypothetical protein
MHQKLTAVVQSLSSIVQKMFNKTLACLPTHTPSNNNLKIAVSIIVTLLTAYWTWSYRTRTQPQPQTVKQKKRPAPINTAHSATIDIGKITPEDQIDKLNTGHLGRFAPRHSPLTDFYLERTYQNIVRRDLGIDADTLELEESDPDYDVLRYLTSVQRALLATLNRTHQDRVIDAMREDWYGSVFAKGADGEDTGHGNWKDDEEFKAEVMRWKWDE